MPLKDRLPLISCALGFIGIVCVLVIGGYLIAWCWSIYSIGIGPSFLTVTIISWILILTSALLLTYGSLKTSRKSTLRGGLINLAAGIEIIPLFIYFYSIFPLLPQFGLLGYLLFLPAIISGIIGLASPKHLKN
jgi:hypothetical protein